MNKRLFFAIFFIIAGIIGISVGVYNILNSDKENLVNSNTGKVEDLIFVDDLILENNSNTNTMYITINGTKLSATLVDNSSSKALVEKLQDGAITIDSNDYGGFEKVGNLGFDLPANDENIITEAGDLILYNRNQLTLHYGSNSWNYTRLGKIDNISQDELKNLLGDGDVTLVLSLD